MMPGIFFDGTENTPNLKIVRCNIADVAHQPQYIAAQHKRYDRL